MVFFTRLPVSFNLRKKKENEFNYDGLWIHIAREGQSSLVLGFTI
jgi:hypothetical protein